MTDTLQKICDNKRIRVAALKKLKPLAVMNIEARRAPPARGFLRGLKAKLNKREIGFIAEIKKASPSAGMIRESFSPTDLANSFASAGAACLSVLTEEDHFLGSPKDLIEARAACRLPVLRKDFMVDLWQVAESRAMGADCILIIMAALDDKTAADINKAALDYGMDVLVEVHDKAELQRALKLPGSMIGVNNRDLKTLRTNLEVTEMLAPAIPKDRLLVSESGLRSASDIARMQNAGAHCFLIGEALLKAVDVGVALNALRLPVP